MASIEGTKQEKLELARLQIESDKFAMTADSFNALKDSSSTKEVMKKANLAREHTSQIMASDWKDLTHAKNTLQKEENILTTIKGINPQDPIESMLASQMIASHNAAMNAFSRSESYYRNTEIEYKKLSQAMLSTANKLLRTYAIQMETLNRYRGKGQQKITVEHVNINNGGKAVIGHIIANAADHGEG